MDITPQLREHALTCAVCRAQLMLILAAKAKVAQANAEGSDRP